MIAIEAILWFPTLLWITLAGLILYWAFSTDAREVRGWLAAAIAGGLVFSVVASIFLRASAVFIEPTERGIVISALDEGIRPEALQPGLNFVVPFLETVLRYPVTRQTYTMSIAPQEGQIAGDDSVEARTSDGQVVRVSARVVFSLQPERVVETHMNWHGRYVDNLIRPQVRGIIRDAVSQFEVSELSPTTRSVVEELITRDLDESLDEGGLLLHDFELLSILSAEDQSVLLERSGAAAPEIAALSETSQGGALEKIRSTLEGLACIVLPILMVVAVIARRRRQAPE
jgi:regulator of protease activity HflC (stomatin/prohibitin superfamily)